MVPANSQVDQRPTMTMMLDRNVTFLDATYDLPVSAIELLLG